MLNYTKCIRGLNKLKNQKLFSTSSKLNFNFENKEKFNSNSNSNNNNNNNNNKGFTIENEELKSNKKENFNNRNLILLSFSISGLFGFNKKEEKNPYEHLVTREKGKPIETLDDALEWYTSYYLQPEPEQFIAAMKLLLGSQSKLFVRQQLNNIKEENEMRSIARISTIQSFYYLPLVGFMIEMFKQNPQNVEKWYKELTSDKDISTPWKSALGDLDAIMLINLAISLTDIPQTQAIEQRIVSQFYTPKDKEEDKKFKLTQFKNWAASQKKSTQSLPLILIGEYFASGKEDTIKKIVSIWRNALDNLEVMGLQSTPGANTTNNVAKRLEFENRELIIDQLSQAIRLLVKDKRAIEVLKSEISHQIKQKEERIKQYK
ncbi:hypothetical protein DICPUDRAFT_84997 [Dictyostelium purpureum]|uniref:Uncharacterized protein n=1 Tax=Dictyostelium purpureum TaxID=5786 RepID=F1A4D2_DICPU|nr:uncharacterized protein DICPUDRAFT_84997 [Dictyostelium purpureum]EGC28945.1 hypothetical protein DICPUDRAFT_84997 [Dictyostelium purpureum]|eukprot:XP_003294526.1 hypothetical protein DICPUDRAFT_84997 [Dictyostelium purpureum]